MPRLLSKPSLVGLMLWVLLPLPGQAEGPAFPSRVTDRAAPSLPLGQLARKAGYIFAGTVTEAVSGPVPDRDHVASMRVTFHVDRGIRGVRTGQMLVIHEWAGRWEFGERYQTGEHVLLFLYPPSKLGLTSTVGGAQGRLNIDAEEQVILDRPLNDNSSPQAAESHGKARISQREFERFILRGADE